VWIDFFRSQDEALEQLLKANQVLSHSMVIGELALGHFKDRENVLNLLRSLPRLPTRADKEVISFIETHQLISKGIGWVDVHLLTAVAHSDNTQLWTRDKRLKKVSDSLGLSSPLI
jgi:predicted nucleic acid-binding protein